MIGIARLLALTIVLGLAFTMPGCPRKCVRPEEPIRPPALPEKVAEIVEPKTDLALATVYFDLDRSEIHKDAALKLEENARKLNEPAAQERSVTVEGHCCPIGTAAHNMALGMRRAEAVKAFLVNLGVSAERLSAVSYGKEKLVTGDPEEYHWNRRVEFRVH